MFQKYEDPWFCKGSIRQILQLNQHTVFLICPLIEINIQRTQCVSSIHNHLQESKLNIFIVRKTILIIRKKERKSSNQVIV